jgi:WD40 repeat protein
MTDFLGGAMVGFPSLAVLYVVGHNADVTSTSLFFTGVSALIALSGKVVCAVPGSSVLRVLGENGRDERILAGHCGVIDLIHKLSEKRFATSGQDDSIRVWDIGELCPVAAVLLPGVGITSLAGSDDFLVCGFKNNRIGVVDLIRGKPFFGIETQNIVPAKLAFDQAADTLYVFGACENELHGPQRTVFDDGERQFEQKIFRKYQRLTGLAADPRRGPLSPPSLFCARKPLKKHM